MTREFDISVSFKDGVYCLFEDDFECKSGMVLGYCRQYDGVWQFYQDGAWGITFKQALFIGNFLSKLSGQSGLGGY